LLGTKAFFRARACRMLAYALSFWSSFIFEVGTVLFVREVHTYHYVIPLGRCTHSLSVRQHRQRMSGCEHMGHIDFERKMGNRVTLTHLQIAVLSLFTEYGSVR
jgi:hypothetical protein